MLFQEITILHHHQEGLECSRGVVGVPRGRGGGKTIETFREMYGASLELDWWWVYPSDCEEGIF